MCLKEREEREKLEAVLDQNLEGGCGCPEKIALYENAVIDARRAIRGEIGGEVLGKITENRENGLFGRAKPPGDADAVATAPLDEVKTGAAVILADVDGVGVREYSIDIERVSDEPDGRDMVVRVTDPALIEKTGGIVQGMSGAPILQWGRLAGAVTHVFINDPRSGYAISADALLKDM